MASIAMLVSEMAHAFGRPNNRAFREAAKLAIIHTRNEIIRHSYEQHGYVDKGMTQRFRVSLTDVNDGDITLPEDLDGIDLGLTQIKRSTQRVPRPVRLTNNLPFDRVSTAGYKTNREFPYIKETSARFRSSVPGLCGMPCYDYINEFIYIFPTGDSALDINAIIIESAFEHPNIVEVNNGYTDEFTVDMDENEWLLSEDMIGQIKDIVYKRDFFSNLKETDEIPQVVNYNQ